MIDNGAVLKLVERYVSLTNEEPASPTKPVISPTAGSAGSIECDHCLIPILIALGTNSAESRQRDAVLRVSVSQMNMHASHDTGAVAEVTSFTTDGGIKVTRTRTAVNGVDTVQLCQTMVSYDTWQCVPL